jgi:hypothetical protein
MKAPPLAVWLMEQFHTEVRVGGVDLSIQQ